MSNVEFNVVSIDDSTSYYLYRYELVNPATSDGVTTVAMDISTTAGTPALLATSGTFFDLTNANPPAHAEVGVDVPMGWQGMITITPELIWELPSEWDTSPDSVAPGDTVSGFLIRSSNLPGLRKMYFGPTVEACCLTPIDSTEGDGISAPIDHEVAGIAIGPRYTANEIDIDLLQSQLDAVCDDPLWIDDTSLCTEMADSLGAAEDRLAIANIEGARAALVGFGGLIQSNVDPLGDIDVPAAYLLGINMLQLLENIGLPPA